MGNELPEVNERQLLMLAGNRLGAMGDDEDALRLLDLGLVRRVDPRTDIIDAEVTELGLRVLKQALDKG